VNLAGPLSVDRFPVGEDEADVDVEQCSDSEAQNRSRTPRTTSNNSRATPQSDDDRLSPEPVRKKVKQQRIAAGGTRKNLPFAISLLSLDKESTTNYGLVQLGRSAARPVPFGDKGAVGQVPRLRHRDDHNENWKVIMTSSS
jgi:hypothetical protein